MNQNKRSDINKSLLNEVQFPGKGFVIQTGKMRIAESGRSMVEMLGVLVIIGILSVVGVASYIYAMNKHRANEIIQGVKERAVIGSGQRMNEHPVDFHEFSELIMDYTTGSQNTGLNGEKEFFTVMVNDVPQAVCQNVLNMNWDWPAGVFVNNVSEEACPVGNHQMAFVFAADLSDKIAREQDPCLGNSCCMAPNKQPIFGVKMDLYECKGEGQKICCKQTNQNACVYPQHSNYETYVSNAQKAQNPTCEQDSKQYCDGDLNCLCRACANANMVQNADTCACSCPNGYQGTPCGAEQYVTAKLEDADGVPVCYKCENCPGLSAQNSRCTYTMGTDENGCPTQTVASCTCYSGYSTTACAYGSSYAFRTITLPDNTRCYKCENCQGDETRPTNKCSKAETKAGQNGCPSRTVYNIVPCVCPSGYSTTKCVQGTSRQLDMKTLPDGTECYKCDECQGDGTRPTDKCSKAETEKGQNGCPDRTVYNIVPCVCSEGYSTTKCVPGTNYQVGTEILPDNTRCYKCDECPGDETRPTDRCTEAETEKGQNGCPDRTVYNVVACACDTANGYTTTECKAGTNYETAREKLPNGTICYQCKECSKFESIDGCIYKTGTDKNKCPTQTLDYCNCPTDKPYNNGKTPCDKSQYDIEYQKELADKTTCYQCSKKEVCDEGYTLDKCEETIMDSYLMNDGRMCYKCVCSKGCCCPDGYTCPGGKNGSRFTGGCKADGGHGKEVTPKICPAGYYCKYGKQMACPGKSETSYGKGLSTAEACRNCDNGYVSADEQRCLDSCPNGSYSKDGKCTTCPKGSYCINNRKNDCDPDKGQYTDQTGSVSCSICPTGKYAKNSRSCDDCPAGYKCEKGIRSGCKASDGYIGKDGICTRCENGKYARSSSSTGQYGARCVTCPAGQYCSGGKIAGDCWAKDGKMSDDGASSCTVCPDGKYAYPASDRDNHGTACKKCPKKKTCSNGKINN